jgi:hypothetical protein
MTELSVKHHAMGDDGRSFAALAKQERYTLQRLPEANNAGPRGCLTETVSD